MLVYLGRRSLLAIPTLFGRTQTMAGSKVRAASGEGHNVYVWAPYSSWSYADLYVVPLEGDSLRAEFRQELLQSGTELEQPFLQFEVRIGADDAHMHQPSPSVGFDIHDTERVAAVEFIETFRPQIALGDGVASINLTSSLSQMYESAGLHDRAFDVYLDAMRQLSLDDPFNTQLATYRNNLAYTFSTTSENVGVGVPFVLQAIAHGNRREASYIDTLGWLYYRQGKLADAEAEIRRALRSSAGSVGSLGELYDHLAAIEAARGYHGKSVWMQIFAGGVEPDQD